MIRGSARSRQLRQQVRSSLALNRSCVARVRWAKALRPHRASIAAASIIIDPARIAPKMWCDINTPESGLDRQPSTGLTGVRVGREAAARLGVEWGAPAFAPEVPVVPQTLADFAWAAVAAVPTAGRLTPEAGCKASAAVAAESAASRKAAAAAPAGGCCRQAVDIDIAVRRRGFRTG